MSDESAPQPSKRGEAAWREAKERVAARNDATRKAGKESRQAYERQRSNARRAAEKRQMEEVAARKAGP